MSDSLFGDEWEPGYLDRIPLQYDDVLKLPPLKGWRYDRRVLIKRRYTIQCDACIRAFDEKMEKHGFCFYEIYKAVRISWETGEVVCDEHTPDWQLATWAALRQWAKHSENWMIMSTLRGRIFYTLKALICILLGREGEYYFNSYLLNGYEFEPDTIENIADFRWRDDSGGFETPSYAASFDVLNVGKGVFTGWFYTITSDSNW